MTRAGDAVRKFVHRAVETFVALRRPFVVAGHGEVDVASVRGPGPPIDDTADLVPFHEAKKCGALASGIDYLAHDY